MKLQKFPMKWKWVLVLTTLVILGFFVWSAYYLMPQRNQPIQPVDVDSVVEGGKIVIGFKKGVSQLEAETLLKKYGLEFLRTNDVNRGQKFFYETGEKFIVTVPAGEEQIWINKLGELPEVYKTNWYINPKTGPLID